MPEYFVIVGQATEDYDPPDQSKQDIAAEYHRATGGESMREMVHEDPTGNFEFEGTDLERKEGSQ
jgi:hypothetical protein